MKNTSVYYEADKLLKQNGHEVLRFPPYHCDLNAIVLIWSLAKRKVASKNIVLPAIELEKHIENKYKERIL